MSVCKHGIDTNKACPWCKTKGRALSEPVKAWQLYQYMFTEFMQEIGDRSRGPVAVLLVVEDGNGEIYSAASGPMDRLRVLEVAAKERLDFQEGIKKCSDPKLNSGFLKRFASILKHLKT